MRMPDPQLHRPSACGGTCCKGQTQQPVQQPGRLQKNGVESDDVGETTAPPIVHDVLRSPGQPLDAATRAYFERRLGHDFSRVRVHINSEAAELGPIRRRSGVQCRAPHGVWSGTIPTPQFRRATAGRPRIGSCNAAAWWRARASAGGFVSCSECHHGRSDPASSKRPTQRPRTNRADGKWPDPSRNTGRCNGGEET